MGLMAFSAPPDKAETENCRGPVTQGYEPPEVCEICQEKARWRAKADKGGEPSEVRN